MSPGFDELIESYLLALDTEYIDSFRELVSKSVMEKFEGINARYEQHRSAEYDDPELQQLNESWIQDDAVYMGNVSTLADELSIVALYKLFEKKHKELLQYHLGENNPKKYSYWKNALNAIPDSAKELESLKSVNELRLVNNSIKHGGVVSKELVDEFPIYGPVESELSGLNEIFDRLKPEVVKYIRELHNEFKNR